MALLCVGNWVPRKGIDSLLEAVARLPSEAATLHLAGDDRAEPRYAARLHWRLAAQDLAGRVVVHGPLPREQVAAGVPMVLYALYFLDVFLTGTVTWSTHLWAGSIVLAGVVGLLLSMLVSSPLGAAAVDPPACRSRTDPSTSSG